MRRDKFTNEALEQFREAYSEVHDFTRCQRPDGTFYGTSGVCRKGSQVGAKERPEKKGRKKAKAEKPKVEAPKKPTDYARGGTLKKDVPGPVAKAGTDKKIYQDQIAKASDYLKKDPDDVFAALMKQRAEKNLQPIVNSENLVEGIVRDVPAGTQVGFKSNGFLGTEFTTPGGTKVTTSFGQGDFNFQVNGKYDAGQVTDRKEQMAIARQVQRVWNAHRQNLPEGYVVMATAWGDDGRGASRVRAYERMGFSGMTSGTDENPGTQYGRVGKGGKIVPSDRVEQGQGSTLLMFAEKGSNKDLGLWYVAIFGVPEKKDDFSETDTFDFTRCQRSDGTFYGTSGVCRSGVQVGPREINALKKAAASGNKRAAVALAVVEGKKTREEAKQELGKAAPKEAAKKKVKPKPEEKAPAPKETAKAAPKEAAKDTRPYAAEKLSVDQLKELPDGSKVDMADGDVYVKKGGKFFREKKDGTLSDMDNSASELSSEARYSAKMNPRKEEGRGPDGLKKDDSLSGRFSQAKPLGEGGYGQVRVTEEGTIIKTGELGKDEVAIQTKLKDVEGVPNVRGSDARFIEMDRANGRALMDSDVFNDALGDGPSQASGQAVDTIVGKLKEVHSRGVSHGDLHDGNVYWDDATGKAGLIDFGLGGNSRQAALGEALTFGTDGNFKTAWVSDMTGRGNAGPAFTKLQGNQKAVAEALRAQGFDPTKELGPQGLSNVQAANFIEQIYEGI